MEIEMKIESCNCFEEKMKALVDKLKSMSKEEIDAYLDECYQNNKEALDKILNADPKDYELPEGMHIVGFENINEGDK